MASARGWHSSGTISAVTRCEPSTCHDRDLGLGAEDTRSAHRSRTAPPNSWRATSALERRLGVDLRRRLSYVIRAARDRLVYRFCEMVSFGRRQRPDQEVTAP